MESLMEANTLSGSSALVNTDGVNADTTPDFLHICLLASGQQAPQQDSYWESHHSQTLSSYDKFGSSASGERPPRLGTTEVLQG